MSFAGKSPVICITVLMTMISSGQRCDAQWGKIKGQVVVTGPVKELDPLVKKGDSQARDAQICAAEEIPDESLVVDPESMGVANVVVWMTTAPKNIHPDLVKSKDAEVVLEVKNCRYKPHALIVRTDQRVLLKSDDEISHNVHPWPVRNSLQGMIVPKQSREAFHLPAMTKSEPLPIHVTCDIHSWMSAWIFFVDHPYSAITNSKGEFEIDSVPQGVHEFRVWQERAGYLVKKDYSIVVKRDETTTTSIAVDPKVFKKQK